MLRDDGSQSTTVHFHVRLTLKGGSRTNPRVPRLWNRSGRAGRHVGNSGAVRISTDRIQPADDISRDLAICS